jgi:SAM-dependent methyltransferase
MFECRNCSFPQYQAVYNNLPDRLHQQEGSHDYVRCKRCGLVQILEVPPDISECYSGYRLHKQESKIYGLFRKLTIGHCYPFIKLTGGKILDIGCGNGWYLREMKKRGWQPFGYEFDFDYASQLSAQLKIPILSGEDSLAGHQEYFDLITFNFSFEHLLQPRRIFELASKALKKGGRIFISVPNIEGEEALLFGDKWFHLDPPRHISFYNQQLLSNLFLEYGFKDVRVKNLAIPTGFAGSISYMLCDTFKPLIWLIATAPGILFSLFIRDGNFMVSGTKAG